MQIFVDSQIIWKVRSYRNQYMYLFKSNNCKSYLNKNLSIEKLDIKMEVTITDDYKISVNELAG